MGAPELRDRVRKASEHRSVATEHSRGPAYGPGPIECPSHPLRVDLQAQADPASNLSLMSSPCSVVARPRSGAQPRLSHALRGIPIALEHRRTMEVARRFTWISPRLDEGCADR